FANPGWWRPCPVASATPAPAAPAENAIVRPAGGWRQDARSGSPTSTPAPPQNPRKGHAPPDAPTPARPASRGRRKSTAALDRSPALARYSGPANCGPAYRADPPSTAAATPATVL